MLDELAKEEKIDGKKFKTYLELTAELKQQRDAVVRMKMLPSARITAGLVGQMTAFVKTLDNETKESLRAFLNTNSKLLTAINTVFK